MKLKYLPYYSFSTLILTFCLLSSLLVVPEIEGGFKTKFHAGLALYAIMAVIFVVEAIKRTKFRLEGIQTLFVYLGLTVGTIGILNIILVNPWSNHNQGLILPWLITFVIIFYFRKLFFPFHLTGSDFVKNIAMGAGILYIFKLSILWGLFSSIPGLKYLSISDSFKNYYNLEIMSFVWLIGVLLYGAGLFLTSQTIRNENESELKSIKNQIGLTRNDMMLLSISNHELMGKSLEEIEDVINARARKIIENYSKYSELNEFVSRSDHGGKKWISNVSGLIEHKPRF